MIYINPIGDNTVWVTSEDDAIGIEVAFDPETDENERILIALAEFLGYDPKSILAFESMDNGISWIVK